VRPEALNVNVAYITRLNGNCGRFNNICAILFRPYRENRRIGVFGKNRINVSNKVPAGRDGEDGCTPYKTRSICPRFYPRKWFYRRNKETLRYKKNT